MKINKKDLIRLVPAVAIATLLSACGDNDDSAVSADPPSEAPAPTPDPAPTPVSDGSLSIGANQLIPATAIQDMRGVTFASDGKIYTSGRVGGDADDRQTVIARFNADGTPDASFGSGGFVTLNVAPKDADNETSTGDEQSRGIAELANKDIIVAVEAGDGNGGEPLSNGAAEPTIIPRPEGTNVLLLRLDSTGAPVTSFGNNGQAVVKYGWSDADNASFPVPGFDEPGTALDGDAFPDDTAWGIELDPSTSGAQERVVVFGYGNAPIGATNDGETRVDRDRYVARILTESGDADPTFNGGEAFSFNSSGTLSDNGRHGVVEQDGKIVSAGYTVLSPVLRHHVFLLRLTESGVLDNTFQPFGESPVRPGVAVFNPFVVDGGFTEAYSVTRQSDGSYVTSGYGLATAVTDPPTPSSLGYESSLRPDLLTFRVKNGALDTSYGTNGLQAIQSEGMGFENAEERGRDVVALPDDRTVHVGRYGGSAAIYVMTKDGQLDTRADANAQEAPNATAGNGIFELGDEAVTAQFYATAVSADGKRVAVTTNADDNGARLVVLDVN